MPDVTLIEIEAVVAVAITNEMARIDRAAEEFEAIVERVTYHDVVDLRAAAHAAEGQAVDFVVGGNLGAGIFDAHVPKNAARVGGAVAPIGLVGRQALDRGGPPFFVDG